MANFGYILEVALIETEFNTKQVWNKGVTDLQKASSFNPMYDFYQDEYLIVNTYDIDAKFGIDFNEIKIKKINNNKIQVCGIKPKYIGSVKNIKNTEIAEIRECQYKEGVPKPTGIVVKKDKDSIIKVGQFEQENNKKYQDSLRDMENWKTFSNAVVSLGKNFIKMIFAPVYSEIEFVEESDESFMCIKDYIDNEISQYNRQMEEKLRPVKIDIIPQEKINSNLEN